MKKDFYYMSCDGMTKIHAIEWIPNAEIKAVLQICHGMVEYIGRYDEFAGYLTERGFYVTGQDHLGHGESVQSDDDHGFFHESEGNRHIIGDIRALYERTKKIHADVPYFLLGHSMGSFLTRQYIQTYPQGLAGAVIMGTGYQPYPMLVLGKMLCRIMKVFKGSRYRSSLINGMALGGYNKSFEPSRTRVDWISKDEAIVDSYLADPWCTFVFTVNGYYHLFSGMQALTKKNLHKIPKELPMFFVAGDKDPVGNFGKGVEKVFCNYKEYGIKDLSLKLYKDDRHEILNETDRQEVFADLYDWMEKHTV